MSANRKSENLENAFGGGNNGGRGGGSQGGGNGESGRNIFAMGREYSRTNDGSILTTATVGTNGYTLSVDHPTLGYAHVTGHRDGTLHRHGYMSDNPKKGDKIKSNVEYSGLIGKIIK